MRCDPYLNSEKMEKICEFCTSLRPVVYCKADSAQLCLSCDARVHSANALSSRHIRTLLCEQCQFRPAYVRCFDHGKFICRTCDRNLHELSSSQHQKQVLTSYMGSPSPMDFAALWGFELKSAASGFGSETSLQNKMYQEGRHQQESGIILQQILELKRLQLANPKKNDPSLIRHEEQQPEITSSKYDTFQKVENYSDQFAKNLHDIGSLQHELEEESFPSPFSQLEQLTSSSYGDPFWQCKSSVRNSQLWSQNMQDLGVCEEFDSFEDFNIPNVDLTFKNYEELFGGNQDVSQAFVDDKDLTFPSTYFDRSDDGSPIPSEGGSADSSAHVDRDIGLSTKSHRVLGSVGSPHFTQPSYPTLPVSLSRLSAESHVRDCDSTDAEITVHSEARELSLIRYKEKKKVRMKEQKGRNSSQKSRTGACKRAKVQTINIEGYESETV